MGKCEFSKYTYFNHSLSVARISRDSPGQQQQSGGQSKQAPNQHIIHHKNGSKTAIEDRYCCGQRRRHRLYSAPVTETTQSLVVVAGTLPDYIIMWVVRHF